jgi:hypothetical protein
MSRFALALAMISLPAVLAPGIANAQQACAPRAQIVAKLSQDFREQQQAVGVVNAQAVLEIYVSNAGTWTIIATGIDGNSCVISAGKDWDSSDFVKGLDTRFHPAAERLPLH